MRRLLQRVTSVQAFLIVAALAAVAALLDFVTGEIAVGVICTVLTAVLLLRALQKHRGRILPGWLIPPGRARGWGPGHGASRPPRPVPGHPASAPVESTTLLGAGPPRDHAQ
jgi:hypothetical protein